MKKYRIRKKLPQKQDKKIKKIIKRNRKNSI